MLGPSKQRYSNDRLITSLRALILRVISQRILHSTKQKRRFLVQKCQCDDFSNYLENLYEAS